MSDDAAQVGDYGKKGAKGDGKGGKGCFKGGKKGPMMKGDMMKGEAIKGELLGYQGELAKGKSKGAGMEGMKGPDKGVMKGDFMKGMMKGKPKGMPKGNPKGWAKGGIAKGGPKGAPLAMKGGAPGGQIQAVSPAGDMVLVPNGPVKRVQISGANRQRNTGIHTIEIYHPQFYFKQTEMEEYDAQPHRYGPSVIGKYTKGIGQIEARFPTDDEDPVSMAMTAVHRVLDRMTEQGFNETGRYSFDGYPINPWNAVGRMDIGSESLIDRSKSMKSYVMDLFERYGDLEHDIEGVDMYNACYGGQAAGLCSLSWIESDRWDGRYAFAIATDISEAHYTHMFTVGCACTCTAYFPDAPVAVHSHRTSCILHRFDFFKPVGWFSMGPVVDGKYSIDCYMQCIDACYQGMKKKMNDRPFLSLSDYNVFHTGGGYHVVKKAFERIIRCEEPKMLADERDKFVVAKLNPSCHLLKIIGPCHTVSSFLNISSVCMSQWEKALGKVTVVFTYGSGCASSMYQLRHDDLPWMKSLGLWKVGFYKDAIYQHPSTMVHEIYISTWMRFDYKPIGRKTFGIPLETLEPDTYYLMEIDPWGRRFYHRGGMNAAPLDRKLLLDTDKKESRHLRDRYGELPETKIEDKRSLEDEWKDIEYEMTFDTEESPEFEIIEESFAKSNPNHKHVVVQMKDGTGKKQGSTVLHDGQPHSYQILGSWSSFRDMEQMEREEDGTFTYEVTLGVNRWEKFILFQDGDPTRKIYPAYQDSTRDQPCVGPHKGGEGHFWLLDGREGLTQHPVDSGNPGDRYLITFRWDFGKVKQLTWEKTEDCDEDFMDDGKYYIMGSWTCWDLAELEAMPDKKDYFGTEVQMTSLGLEFQLVRNGDMHQRIYPDISSGKGTSNSLVTGPDNRGKNVHWEISGNLGDVFRITFARVWFDKYDSLKLTWERVGSRPVIEPRPRYFLVGSPNNWGEAGGLLEMHAVPGEAAHVAEIRIARLPEEIQILENKIWSRCIHPDKSECTQAQQHKVLKDAQGHDMNWVVGKAAADKARIGDSFRVRLQQAQDGTLQVTWKKVEFGAMLPS